MEGPALLQYIPFNSMINPSFWHKLTELKLDVDKLNETNREIWGYFTNLEQISNVSLLEIDSTSFNTNFSCLNTHLPVKGRIYNKNTIEHFKECDKTSLIQEEGCKLWGRIEDGSCIKDPSLLNTFFMLTFADLKKYHYYYWFAFPTPAAINVELNSLKKLSDDLNDEKLTRLLGLYNNLETKHKQFFIINKTNLQVLKLEELIKVGDANNLSHYEEYYFAYSDPSSNSEFSGWPARNYILLLLHHCVNLSGKSLSFLALRLGRNGSQIACNNSLVLQLKLPDFSGCVGDVINLGEKSGWIGWERNERNKLGPRMCNMKSAIDPKCLAESAVDLNLKLIKWRLVPELNLDKVKNTKCLLLGAGTLGCSVARTLLGWGVRNITFVDNSTVSYSNPVRQSLYTYDDCVKSSLKAHAAADNLKKIFPGVDSVGYELNIPMPGHQIGESLLETTKEAVTKLTELIQSNDIIFLLMDSRESRWLPTVLGMHFGKLVINAALGFDTYLVMRHGTRVDNDATFEEIDGYKMIRGDNLGCYFCNDVTAPGNSMKDRTLDQNCTVTRPGISQIAGAMAVELAVSILQHEKGFLAPAYYKLNRNQEESERENDCILGLLPHSIRGFLSTFTHVLPATEKYNQCIACSDYVLNEYKASGFEFLLKVFNSSKYLEDLTGLTKMFSEQNEEMWELSDSEEEM